MFGATIIFSSTGMHRLINVFNISHHYLETRDWLNQRKIALAKRKNWRFFSVGSIVATFLFILSSLGVSFFVNHFGRFNKLYGSIGSLMVVLIWLYFNSISILIGFELNASIHSANLKKNIYLTKNSSKKRES